MKDVEFEIAPQNIKRLTKNILVPDVLADNAAKYNKVTPVITDLDEKKLKKDKRFHHRGNYKLGWQCSFRDTRDRQGAQSNC